MASRPQRTGPIQASDNRAQMQQIGTREAPQQFDYAAMADNAVDATSPDTSSAMVLGMEPTVSPVPVEPTAPAQTPQPTQAPTPEGQSAPEVAAPEADELEKLPPDELKKLARNQRSLIGRHADEVGTYRKLFDKMLAGQLQVTPPAATPQQVDPTDKFMTPKLDEAAKQELIALSLTDPERHEEVLYKRFRKRMEGEVAQNVQREQQNKLMETFQKVQDVVTSPDFQQWERSLPQHVIDAAKQNPDTLQWVVNQFQGSRGAPQSVPAQSHPAQEHAAQAPRADRVTRLGTAAGAPASGNPERSKHVFTLREIAELQLNRPEEYIARQTEIAQAYREGRVK